ncbi:MAG: hypothetical protein KGI35_00900 [Burkholderiales bacterium]|nr:hypothetical protein [Burkholderiales bacterium]MDE2399229.1 hypothetical protein [Burkholderiales bacterium]
MAGATDFTKMVPGFDFLQGLIKGAGASMPSIGQWVAPTLDPEELEKRIGELRTVQFWLEQNARMLGVTIQALEVQRMTLSTLRTMNLPLEEMRKGFELRVPDLGAPAAEPAPPAAAESPPPKAQAHEAAAATEAAPKGPVDPMQWWSALTQQFTELAANAIKDSSAEAAKSLAANAVKQSLDAAGRTVKAASAPLEAAKAAAKAAPKPARKRASG